MPFDILMPALSPTMEEGNLANWLKAEGDTVEAGDVIAEIETDKATMEVEAVDGGVLGKILVNAGTEGVKVNAPIAVMLEEGEDKAALDGYSAGGNAATGNDTPTETASTPDTQAQPTAETSAPAPTQTVATIPNSAAGGRVFASPIAKRIAKDKGLDLSQITGTGPNGRIVKADVEKASAGGSAAAAPQAGAALPVQANGANAKTADALGIPYTAEKVTSMRKVIAKRLTESKQTVPHFYLTVECQLDAMLAARKALNEAGDGAYKVSVNDFIIKASAMALKAVPAANATWDGDTILMYDRADISVAVATPTGLITPIIVEAENKGLIAISSEMKDLAKRARDGKLKPAEYQGGTFSLSNLGMFGIKEFGAIINPPQGCILAVGAGEKRPVYNAKGDLVPATLMNATLSVDHRVVDGAVGAQYLQAFKRFLENPVLMLG